MCLAAFGALIAAPIAPAGAADAPVSFPSVPIASWRVNGSGYAALKIGNTVYIGGSYSRATSPDGATSVAKANLAAFDATTGALITTFRADTNGVVRDLETDGTSLFVGGGFTTVGGVSRSRLAALDPVTGAVRTSFRADVGGTVYNMSLGGGKLYVAGSYTTIGGAGHTRLAAVSPVTGAVNAAFNPVINGTVLGVAARPDGSRVYLGGPYTTINGAAATNLNTVDGTTGALAGPTLTGVIGYIDELEVSPDGSTLVAGHSGVVGIGNRTSVYDTATGARRWTQGVGGDVQGTHLVGGTVFSGFHDGAGGDGSSRLAAYNASTGARDLSFRPVFDKFMGVWSISGDSSALVVAGEFTTISGVSVQGFAIFRSGPPTSFVATSWGNEQWKYLDNGSNQGTAWSAPGFNDSSWKTGTPIFGYGAGGETTKVAYGPSSSARYRTTYFRRTFNVTGSAGSAAVYMRIDDGAVVYINGVEASRDNMPPGPINSATAAASERSTNAASESRYSAINPALLHVGSNTIAVEVHKASLGTPNLQFFPTFVAYASSTPNRSPSAAFTASSTSGPAPLVVNLNGSGSTDPDGSIVAYNWNFGDGTTGTGATTTKTFTTAGTRVVSLTVTDNRGATATTSRTIQVVGGVPNDPPVASFTITPNSGQAPLPTQLDASSSTDPDGTIAAYNWNFGDGTTGTGATTTKTFTTGGTFTVTLTVTDNRGGTASATRAVAVAAPPGSVVDLTRAAVWKYLDIGADPGPLWRTLSFDDSSWRSGVGEFGYGDGDEHTVVSYGPSATRKYPTTYFRTTFAASAVPQTATFTMRVDDGAVVYINGVEAARFNMGPGAVDYSTRAPLAIANGDERLDRTFSISPSLIAPGTNIVAVEVHQNTLGSSDLTFWGSLTGT